MPAATVAPFDPPFQVIRVIALVLGAVVAGPIAEPVMFRAAVAEALTVTLTVVALALINVWSTCSRQFRVALSVLEVPESCREKIGVETVGAREKAPFESGVPLAVDTGPIPASVIFSAFAGAAFTVMRICEAELVISPTGICCRQLRVPESFEKVPESDSAKMFVGTAGARVYPDVFRSEEALRIGFAPLPYAPIVIGLPLEPLEGNVSAVPYQMQLRSNRTESPAAKVEAFTLATVSQGVPVDVPLFESLPTTTQLST